MKTQIFPALVAAMAVAVSLSSCGLKKEKITPAPPVKVTVLPVSASGIGSTRSYSGTVTSGDGAEVSFSVPGTVKAIYVSEGQKVSKGQLLAELKADNLANANNIAQAALDEARDSYNRFKQLHDANALADIKWVEVQNALKAAENSAAVAARALGDARIYSPVSGTVSEKLIDVGQTVIPAMPVIRVVALGDVKVSIPVPEGEIAAMSTGRKADITVEALDNRKISGTLTEKGVVANPLTRAYDVKFSVGNADGSLLPGMICNVVLLGDSTVTRAMVLPPQSVLLAADNRNFVWIARNGKAEQRFVQTDGLTADGVIIKSGIQPGDSVIVAGMQKVSSGTPVTTQI